MTTNAHSNGAATNFEHYLTEIFDALWNDFVDPREAYWGEEGGWWAGVGAAAGAPHQFGHGPVTEQQLADLRNECRRLAATNEFAASGHENRISYVVGPGHSYRATICKGMDAPAEIALAVQKLLDDFVEENRWHTRQQEVVRRVDRDGEAFCLPGMFCLLEMKVLCGP